MNQITFLGQIVPESEASVVNRFSVPTDVSGETFVRAFSEHGRLAVIGVARTGPTTFELSFTRPTFVFRRPFVVAVAAGSLALIAGVFLGRATKRKAR